MVTHHPELLELAVEESPPKTSPERESRGLTSVFPPGPWLLSQRKGLQPLLIGAGPVVGWQPEGCLCPPFLLYPNPTCHRQDAMSWHGLCEAGAASVPGAGGGGEAPPALTPTRLSPRDEEIQSKCGIDATTYLSFQRHLLVLLMLVCVLSVAVILPVNFSGDLLGRCFPSCGKAQEHGTSFSILRPSTLPWGQRAEEPLRQEPQCEQKPTTSCGTEERRRRVLQGGGGLAGTWEMEKEGAKTRATNSASMDTHAALGSHNLLLLFPCRTQSHPLRPDNHRQHPNTVRGFCVWGGLWALLLQQALLGVARHGTHHSPRMGTGPREQHAARGSPRVCPHRARALLR